jgi:hypothetical protein
VRELFLRGRRGLMMAQIDENVRKAIKKKGGKRK